MSIPISELMYIDTFISCIDADRQIQKMLYQEDKKYKIKNYCVATQYSYLKNYSFNFNSFL